MNTTIYMRRFERALRWYISEKQEIDNILEKYRSLFGQRPDGEVEMRIVGYPEQEARRLRTKKEYFRWQLQFVTLLIGIVLTLINGIFNNLHFLISGMVVCFMMAVILMITIRRKKSAGKGKKSVQRIWKKCFFLMFMEVCFIGGIYYTYLNCREYIMQAITIEKIMCVTLFLLGIYGLVKSRVDHLHYIAIYATCLICISMHSVIISVVCSMNATSIEEINLKLYMTGILMAGLCGLWGLLCKRITRNIIR